MTDTDRLAALLIEVFPAANRNQWPFAPTDVAAALIAAGVTCSAESDQQVSAPPSDPAAPLRCSECGCMECGCEFVNAIAAHQHNTDACDECDTLYAQGREDAATLGTTPTAPPSDAPAAPLREAAQEVLGAFYVSPGITTGRQAKAIAALRAALATPAPKEADR